MQEGFDVGLEMSGNAQAFREMLRTMHHGGSIAILGIPPEETAIDWDQVIFKGLTLKGIYGREMFETWYKMASLLQSGLNIGADHHASLPGAGVHRRLREHGLGPVGQGDPRLVDAVLKPVTAAAAAPPGSALLGDSASRDYGAKLARFSAFAAPELAGLVASLGLVPGMRVVDAGCGTGEVLGLMAASVGPSGCAVGLDLSAAHARAALGAGRLVVQADLLRAPLPPGGFDLVWSLNTVQPRAQAGCGGCCPVRAAAPGRAPRAGAEPFPAGDVLCLGRAPGAAGHRGGACLLPRALRGERDRAWRPARRSWACCVPGACAR